MTGEPLMRVRLIAVTAMLAVAPLSLARDAGAQTRPRPALDACKLLSAAEIKRVQHTALQETKASAMPADGAMSMRQCFYRAESHADSVSLLIAEPAQRPSKVVREYWDATLVKASQTEVNASANGEMTKSEAKKQRHKPEAVPGLGDQAWWVGDQKAGALYVLDGDRFFRISIGGKIEDNKRARMVALANIVLKKLRAS